MALTSTVYNFEIELSDVDRGVYASFPLRVACHPSEAEDYLLTRVLAYCLEFTEGLEFGRGLSEPDDPALVVRDLTGVLRAWIEVGAPDARRLHKASKAVARVAVYVHKDPAPFLRRLEGEKIHRAEAIEFRALDRALLAGFVARLERRTAFALAVNSDHLYLTVGGETLVGVVERHALAPG